MSRSQWASFAAILFIFAFVGVAGGAEPTSDASAAPGDVIRYRQTVMRAIASHLKALTPISAKKVPFAKHAVLHAQAVVELSKVLGELFPKGTGPSSGETDAMDSIWKDAKAWNQSLESFRLEATRLAAAASVGEFTALRAQVEVTNDSCAACHTSFRAGR